MSNEIKKELEVNDKDDYAEIAKDETQNAEYILTQTLVTIEDIMSNTTRLINLSYEMNNLSKEDLEANKELIAKIYNAMTAMAKMQAIAYK